MKSPDGLKKYSSAIGLIALIIPFAAMILMIGINVQRLARVEYRLPIEGYDPRDLLRGHYLNFYYKWPKSPLANACVSQSEGCCACLSGEPKAPAVSFSPCRTLREGGMCNGIIQVKPWGPDNNFQPDESLRQYYISEAQAVKLGTMAQTKAHHFKIGLVPQPGGGWQLKMLYIDDKPLPQFLSEMRAAP